MPTRKTTALAFLVLAATVTHAIAGNAIRIEAPYARAVPPTAANSAAFMVLHNGSDAQRQLVDARSDVSRVTELHNHINDNGVMRMRRVSQITIPAQGSVALQPGSFHVMLIGLKSPLKDGDPVNVQLTFDDGSEQSVSMKATRSMAGMMHEHHNHH